MSDPLPKSRQQYLLRMTSPCDQLILPVQKSNARIRQRLPKLIASDFRT